MIAKNLRCLDCRVWSNLGVLILRVDTIEEDQEYLGRNSYKGNLNSA